MGRVGRLGLLLFIELKPVTEHYKGRSFNGQGRKAGIVVVY